MDEVDLFLGVGRVGGGFGRAGCGGGEGRRREGRSGAGGFQRVLCGCDGEMGTGRGWGFLLMVFLVVWVGI